MERTESRDPEPALPEAIVEEMWQRRVPAPTPADELPAEAAA